MRAYPNFYENLNEAQCRLNKTTVLYDGIPYYIEAISDHEDGILRVWMTKIGEDQEAAKKLHPFRIAVASLPFDHPALGGSLEKVLNKDPDCGVVRKMINSPKFNRFRPFPLGMCNVGTQCYYVERQPIRPLMHQGLVRSALFETLLTAGSRHDNPRRVPEVVEIHTPAFRDCILGDYHAPAEVLRALLDTRIANDACGFNREFAFVRGPIGMLFMAYRSDIIGILPNNSLDCVKLGREFKHCREVVEELHLFNRII